MAEVGCSEKLFSVRIADPNPDNCGFGLCTNILNPAFTRTKFCSLAHTWTNIRCPAHTNVPVSSGGQSRTVRASFEGLEQGHGVDPPAAPRMLHVLLSERSWHEVPCTTAPMRPYPPKHGSGSYSGNGNDVSAQVATGLISVAQGSFDSVTGVTSETGDVDGEPPAVANTFSLQLNSNFFSNSPSRDAAATPTNCLAWEQFVFSNPAT